MQQTDTKGKKTRYDLAGKIIHWELFKRLRFDHTTKWYVQNPESVLKNATQKVLKYFEIQTEQLIPARKPDLELIN